MRVSYKYKLALWLLNRVSYREQVLLYLALVWRIKQRIRDKHHAI